MTSGCAAWSHLSIGLAHLCLRVRCFQTSERDKLVVGETKSGFCYWALPDNNSSDQKEDDQCAIASGTSLSRTAERRRSSCTKKVGKLSDVRWMTHATRAVGEEEI